MSRARWAIEVMFRDLKQHLGFGRLTFGGEGGAHLSICIPLILYTSLRIDSELWQSHESDSIGLIVGSVKERSKQSFINLILNQANGNKLRTLRARFRNSTKKPTNICGVQNKTKTQR